MRRHYMFDNIGTKLKLAANILFWVGGAISIVVGIVLCSLISWWQGLLFLILGLIGTWISTLVMFAIGECIHRLQEISEKLAELESATQKNTDTQSDTDTQEQI